jgi:hypothetical protein
MLGVGISDWSRSGRRGKLDILVDEKAKIRSDGVYGSEDSYVVREAFEVYSGKVGLSPNFINTADGGGVNKPVDVCVGASNVSICASSLQVLNEEEIGDSS